MYLLGIDVGSSSLKAAVFDEKGNTLSVAKEEYPICVPQDGYAEQDAQEYYAALLRALKKTDKTLLGGVEAACICGQSPTEVFVDKQGVSVHPAIMWRDNRAQKQFERQKQTFTFEQLDKLSGCPVPNRRIGRLSAWHG